MWYIYKPSLSIYLTFFFSKPLPTFYVTYFPTCFHHFDLGLPQGCFPFIFMFKIFCGIAGCVSVSNLYGMGNLQSLLPTTDYLLYTREEPRHAVYS